MNNITLIGGILSISAYLGNNPWLSLCGMAVIFLGFATEAIEYFADGK